IHNQFDAIVDFADVEKFLDTPVKRYSSGMYVRLAFAVAAHLRTEILIVDEVLAVGDAEFQKKCLGKMQDVAEGEGRTVLFVSHQMHSVSTLCSRGVFLDAGRITYDGSVSCAVDTYMQSFSERSDFELSVNRRLGEGGVVLTNASVEPDCIGVTDDLDLTFRLERRHEHIESLYMACLIVNEQGRDVVHFDSRFVHPHFSVEGQTEGHLRVRNLWLKPGRYRVDLAVCGDAIHDRVEGAAVFSVVEPLPYPYTNDELRPKGVVLGDFSIEVGTEPATI
ncbi:MAG: Wzt carbohydrate-binding domain-containing protein, partial [Firmicutes bacterium]|nr:Wzt carbohydrate-binding domain-containing protein [Bacillota bacterium]